MTRSIYVIILIDNNDSVVRNKTEGRPEAEHDEDIIYQR